MRLSDSTYWLKKRKRSSYHNNFHIKKQFSYIQHISISLTSLFLLSSGDYFSSIGPIIRKRSIPPFACFLYIHIFSFFSVKNVLIKEEIKKTEIKLILGFYHFCFTFIAFLFVVYFEWKLIEFGILSEM